jgi:hypothetical protein
VQRDDIGVGCGVVVPVAPAVVAAPVRTRVGEESLELVCARAADTPDAVGVDVLVVRVVGCRIRPRTAAGEAGNAGAQGGAEGVVPGGLVHARLDGSTIMTVITRPLYKFI